MLWPVLVHQVHKLLRQLCQDTYVVFSSAFYIPSHLITAMQKQSEPKDPVP